MSRVLVVDDDPVALRMVKATLESAHFEVVTTSNALMVAVELERLKPDLLLIDVEMPSISGPTVIEALRHGDCLQSTRVLLYSVTNEEELRQLAMQCGAGGGISKKVVGEELINRIEFFLDNETHPFSVGPLLGKDALIVVYEAPQERKARRTLLRLGLTVRRGGAAALAKNLRERPPDLLLLDPKAFDEDLDTVLSPLREDRLLDQPLVITLGECNQSDSCLNPEEIEVSGLRLAVKEAYAAQDRRGPTSPA